MPDLNINAAGVAPVTTAGGGLIPTVTARGTAGAAITPGQVVYADPSAANLLKPASGTVQPQAANVVGISLGSAALNQPLTYAVSGDVTLPTSGAGSILTSGSVYVLSNNPGNIVSTADNAGSIGSFITLLGVGNGTVSAGSVPTLRLGIIAAGPVKTG